MCRSATASRRKTKAHSIARRIHEADIRTVTINMEHVAFDQGLAQRLADQLGGPCYTPGADPRRKPAGYRPRRDGQGVT